MTDSRTGFLIESVTAFDDELTIESAFAILIVSVFTTGTLTGISETLPGAVFICPNEVKATKTNIFANKLFINTTVSSNKNTFYVRWQKYK